MIAKPFAPEKGVKPFGITEMAVLESGRGCGGGCGGQWWAWLTNKR